MAVARVDLQGREAAGSVERRAGGAGEGVDFGVDGGVVCCVGGVVEGEHSGTGGRGMVSEDRWNGRG